MRQDGVIDGARTRDNRYHKPGLYQLSYDHHLWARTSIITAFPPRASEKNRSLPAFYSLTTLLRIPSTNVSLSR